MIKMDSEFIKSRTCYVLDVFSESLDELAEALPKKDADKINEFLGFMGKLNREHGKLCENNDDD